MDLSPFQDYYFSCSITSPQESKQRDVVTPINGLFYQNVESFHVLCYPSHRSRRFRLVYMVQRTEQVNRGMAVVGLQHNEFYSTVES